MKKPFTVAASLEGVSPHKDGTMGLRFNTQELGVGDKVELLERFNQFGWLLFSPNEIAEDDIPSDEAVKEGKSPAQRLRGVMYVYWKEKEIDEPFIVWYGRQIEKVIDSFKERLDG